MNQGRRQRGGVYMLELGQSGARRLVQGHVGIARARLINKVHVYRGAWLGFGVEGNISLGPQKWHLQEP